MSRRRKLPTSPRPTAATASVGPPEHAAGRRSAASPPLPPVPFPSPALIAAALVAAAGILVSVSFTLYDPDIWQNITVGKAIWLMHGAPHTQIWSWPTYGAPDIKWTWGFSALLWPVWEHGGVLGLFMWRWVTTLLAFGVLWAAARRMGATGFLPLVVMVTCSLVWRARSQVRPETLVAVLLALEIWILEARRHGGADRTPWLVAIAWVWANVHNSYFIGFALIGFHWLDAVRDRIRRGPGSPGGALAARLAWVALGALAISFLNPYGWRLLWQPFDFFLHRRNEILFKSIGELSPLDVTSFWRSGLPLIVVGWPLLIVARARRGGFDLVEALCCVFFTALALPAQRFVGFYSLVAVPYLSRDLHVWEARPAWLRRAPLAARAALASLACVAVGLAEWTGPSSRLGVGFVWTNYPVRACDFMEAHGVRGRGFNQFGCAGYQVYRFWPDRSRLPFMDIHQAGTPADRYIYAWAQQDRKAWLELDRRYRFDYVIRSRLGFQSDSLLDRLDADSTWALVFVDDAAALYVRREGPLAGVAREFAYHELPAGARRLGPLGARCATDSALRARTAAELERVVAGSPHHGQALILLANIALTEGRLADAQALLERAIASSPETTGAHQRLAIIALEEGRARDALREIGREQFIDGPSAALDVLAGRSWRSLGQPGRARAAYRSALRRQPENAEALDSLSALEPVSAR